MCLRAHALMHIVPFDIEISQASEQNKSYNQLFQAERRVNARLLVNRKKVARRENRKGHKTKVVN